MAEQITIECVKEIECTTLPNNIIQSMIDLIDQADACLDSNSVPAPEQKMLKLYAVAHQVVMATGGQISSKKAPNGASQNFAVKAGNGLMATNWGQLLKSMDTTGCVKQLLENSQQLRFLSVGPGGTSECNC